jgi:hypothetical protein
VQRMSPPVLNQVGHRSHQTLLKFLAHMGLPPAGRRLGVPHESRSGNRCFQIVSSRRLKFDGFNYVGYPYVPPVLEGRLRPQNVSFAELGDAL